MTNFLTLLKTFAAICLLCSFLTCNNSNNIKTHVNQEVEDMGGRKMLVPDSIKKVYVNKPGNALIYAIDPEITVCRGTNFNKQASAFISQSYLEQPYIDGSVEEILKYKPDIIISCYDINDKTKDEADRLFKKTGIPVFLVEIDMNKYSATFDLLGDLLNRKLQTDKMKTFVNKYLDTISIKAKQIPDNKKINVYYAEGDCGLETDPSGSKHSQIIDFVGGKNVANVEITSEKGMIPVSMEQIMIWNPDIILCWTGMGKSLNTLKCIKSDKAWQLTRAVKFGKVYQIPFLPFSWFDRPPGTNRIIGTIWTAQLLYPDLFKFDLEEATKEYYEIFYHHRLTDKELKVVLYPE
jgi:iron complex transport system substrate-binding protein